ncbi:hypothetical protein CRENBAI_007678 [Crenichthys baileyi]|uniref:HNH endonuclease n=1 Tax=Crenichthys baileyi TaxID=28760 RepID=A0AAV9SC94_9TELE
MTSRMRLLPVTPPKTLEALERLATWIDQRLREQEPMQSGKTKRSAQERERRFRNHLCFYCGEGYAVPNLPV